MSKHATYCETPDGAKIYFEDQGQGQPIIFLHGWLCTSKFWKKNVTALAETFRVITIDFRGHGNSSKILSGHTITQYAQDVRAVIEQLGLTNVVLIGWSLGGPVVLAYWQQYSHDARLKALGLIDITPAPFSPADWNSHGLKNYNVDGMNKAIKAYVADPKQFAIGFANNMFKGAKAPAEDVEWMVDELTKTPTWIGAAIYADFLISDYANVLATVTVPTIIYASNSNVYKAGVKMGQYLAAQIPQATFLPFEDTGHPLFYEQPERFNQSLQKFVRELG